MSVQTQIDRISGAVQSALAALAEKGVTVPSGTKVDGLAALIAAIESGGGGGSGGGIEVGTITLAARTSITNSSQITIDHNLGRVPYVFYIYDPNTASAQSDLQSLICVNSDECLDPWDSLWQNDAYTRGSSSGVYVHQITGSKKNNRAAWSENSVTFPLAGYPFSGVYLNAGATYYWVVI